MSKYVGEKGNVIAFEPQLKLFSELAMNANLNQCQNVSGYRCAVGGNFKQIEMNVAIIDNEGGTSIGTGGDIAEMIPLDSLHLQNVSLIKIDVENTENEVLKGAQETIRQNRPYIIIEILGNLYTPVPDRTERVHETFAFLQQMGYSSLYLEGSWGAIG
jgi:FkbM family methyltransferase